MQQAKEKLCFVLMPFKENLKEVYWKAIKPACIKAGFRPLRVDELTAPVNINRQIIEHIFISEAIIADLTDWNPNVFYELGVSHTIDNKTIMIIQQGSRLPFDVNTYRSIFYDYNDAGLDNLRERIIASLNGIQEWRKHSTNPVQEYKPFDAVIPKSKVDAIYQELSQKEKENSALKRKIENLNYQLYQTKGSSEENNRFKIRLSSVGLITLAIVLILFILINTPLKDKKADLSKSQLNKQESEKQSNEKLSSPVRFRNEAKIISELYVKVRLSNLGLHDERWNPNGKGITHNYKTLADERYVLDLATNLTWQRHGLIDKMSYDNAENYTIELNNQKFGGFNNWRLPTLEEAMTLIEQEKKGELFLDPVFSRKLSIIWTSDKIRDDLVWVVRFDIGTCSGGKPSSEYEVLVVRS